MERFGYLGARPALVSIAPLLFLLLVPGYSLAQDDLPSLRQQVEEQRALIREQKQQLKEQQRRLDDQARELDKLGNRVEEMAGAKGPAAPEPTVKPQAVVATESKEGNQPTGDLARDSVGDLNAEAVKEGEFPGSIRIPGPGKISLAIGGFIKTVAIEDSKAENMGADFLPASLGTKYPDEDGQFSIDATLTRLHIEAHAPVRYGKVRGYLEWDLNSANNGNLGTRWRLAYGSWTNDYGTLTAGQDWSTFMDVKVLPEGLTEPTVSGAIFNRQGLIRWSQALSPEVTYHIAIEDPNSNDFFADQPPPGHTSVPDVVLGVEYDQRTRRHARLNGILRRVEVDSPTGGNDTATGWGLAFTGYLHTFGQDKIGWSGVYGKGLGRYLLGITSNSGGAIDPVTGDLDLNKNYGGMVSYIHHWTEKLRSTAMLGYARADTADFQAGSFFKSSTYASANLMWSVQPYLTVGAEYAYGSRENKDGSDLDNQRFAVGIQLF